jgi:hypothetical protein
MGLKGLLVICCVIVLACTFSYDSFTNNTLKRFLWASVRGVNFPISSPNHGITLSSIRNEVELEQDTSRFGEYQSILKEIQRGNCSSPHIFAHTFPVSCKDNLFTPQE